MFPVSTTKTWVFPLGKHLEIERKYSLYATGCIRHLHCCTLLPVTFRLSKRVTVRADTFFQRTPQHRAYKRKHAKCVKIGGLVSSVSGRSVWSSAKHISHTSDSCPKFPFLHHLLSNVWCLSFLFSLYLLSLLYLFCCCCCCLFSINRGNSDGICEICMPFYHCLLLIIVVRASLQPEVWFWCGQVKCCKLYITGCVIS